MVNKIKSEFSPIILDIDDCLLNACANGGLCVDGVYNYSCICPAGYTGDLCETGKVHMARVGLMSNKIVKKSLRLNELNKRFRSVPFPSVSISSNSAFERECCTQRDKVRPPD